MASIGITASLIAKLEPEKFQIESPEVANSKSEKRMDKFVLIGHSDQIYPRTENSNKKLRQKKYYQKDYQSKDPYSKYNYLDEGLEVNELSSASGSSSHGNMSNYYNPRFGIYSSKFSGSNLNSKRNGYNNFNGNVS